jgi:predicted RNA methylase
MIDSLREHAAAIANPAAGFERPVVAMVKALAEYADAHRQRYGDPIRQDYILGEYWHMLGEALIGLLNGETGRLDCGTLDRTIRDLIDSSAGPEETRAAVAAVSPPAPLARASKRPKSEPRPAEAIGVRRLTDRQRELVALVDVVDNVANFRQTEHIPDWLELKSTLVALGGKWRSKKGFIFPDDVDAAERVRLAAATGEILDPKAASFFPTPEGLADELVRRARIEPGQSVLEPSAGRGALALAVRRACPEAHLACVEALPDNANALRALGLPVFEGDFLAAPFAPAFNRVVMNPPFEGRADIAHVRRAFDLLLPGGLLVAVMSSGVAHRQDALAAAFRAEVAANAGEIIENAEGAFLESGTAVRTVTVTMRRAA